MTKTHKTKPLGKKSLVRKVLILLMAAALLAGAIFAYRLYQKVYGPNVVIEDAEYTYLYIPSGSQVEDVYQRIREKSLIEDQESFKWLAEKKNYPSHLHPGKYKIREGMSNNALINLLRAGRQEPVDLIFN